MRDSMRALSACCVCRPREKHQVPRLVFAAQARLGAAFGMTRFLKEIAEENCFQRLLERLLGRYFLGAALLAEFQEEFFLAERIGAV